MTDTAPTLTLTRRHKRTITIDGVAIRVLIARFTSAQHAAFTKALARLDEPESLRLLSVRKPGDEQEKRPVARVRPTAGTHALAIALETYAPLLDQLSLRTPIVDGWPEALAILRTMQAAAGIAVGETKEIEVFVVPDEEIVRRRRAEMTSDERARLDQLEAEEDADAQQTIATALECIAIEPGQIAIEEEDGRLVPVTSGVVLGALYASRVDVLRACVREVWAANTLSAVLKNVSGSQSDSQPSSSASGKAAPGPRPETTAAGVAREDSAGTADATDAIADTSSGSMTTSS